MKISKVSLSLYFHQNALHKKYYKIGVTAIESYQAVT